MSSLHSFKAIFVKGLAFASLTLLVPLGHANTFNPDSAQDPLFLTAPVRPLMMLNMSNDHQLFFKLYDDYSDLDGDGQVDTTYMPGYVYYGYFDSGTCYAYDTGNDRFNPAANADAEGYCDAGNEHWSGNFLNWATMTRMDAVRKILYGGKRVVDSADTDDADGLTVLGRAFLPNDAHSFAKYYDGPSIDRLTPFAGVTSEEGTSASGITICNTTHRSSGYSQNVDSPPLMRVAKGNYSLWASNERWQCLWQEDISGKGDVSFNSGGGKNSNETADSGIPASDVSPQKSTSKLGDADYDVMVTVCASGFREENCVRYPDGDYKPVGLLQEYGEDGTIHFGLITGSYGKNKSGGVLRKRIGDLTDEVAVNTNGTFKTQPAGGGIIATLDRFRLYGYNFNTGLYSGSNDNSDNCTYGLSSFSDGNCSNWGNPQSEIYLESLRYLSGLSASPAFNTDDSGYITGLTTAAWSTTNDDGSVTNHRPITNENYCAPLSVIQFNASTSSYDGDQLSGASNVIPGETSLDSMTDAVGVAEGVSLAADAEEDATAGTYFFGELDGGTGNDVDQLCTAKSINNLSNVLGTCPDAPRLEGSYQIAGLAYSARRDGIPLSGVTLADDQTVRTFGVALAPAVPAVNVPVPGSANQSIYIQPACRNTSTSTDSNCAIVDFKVVQQNHSGGENAGYTGKLYVNWEDSEQGGDYDQDMWGVIDYTVTSTNVTIGTHVIAQSTPNRLGFGYVIGGTNKDGFHVHSGINEFSYVNTQYTGVKSCGQGELVCDCSDTQNSQCDKSAAVRTEQEFTVGSSSGENLEQPLYYAAKWGGYDDDDWGDDDIRNWGPEGQSYFFAQEPRELADSLRKAFGRVAATAGSASAVATNSTRLEQGGYVYQARFNSEDWSGEVRAFEILAGGRINPDSAFSTKEAMENMNLASRNVLTVNSESGQGVPFEWDQLSDDQKGAFALADGPDTVTAQDRFNWLRGSDAKEGSGGLRDRDVLLGDIVNSSPVYFGARNEGLASYRGDYRDYLEVKAESPPLLLVGANDGMLHAFYADDSSGQAMQERFAYVPKGVYPYLANLSEPNYGSNENPHHYTVDGGLAIADVYDEGSEQWRTVVAGTLGAGGKGVYALDITDPSSPEVIFDYTGENEADLGYIMGSPVIARTADGKWRVFFGNGYDSGGDAYLFAIDLANPSLTDVKIAAGEVSTGLSPVSLLADRSGAVERAYAGDLLGNMWRFDLGADSSDDWSLGLSGQPLFTARDADDNLQPITAAPELGFNLPKDNAVMVYFGTGKYLDQADNDIDYGNSIYAIADTGEALTYTEGSGFDRSDILSEKDLSLEDGARQITGNFEVDWSDKEGWFLDFDLSDGERLVQKPSLLFDRLLFATILPSTIPCEYGGTSWLMELAAVGDRFGEDTLLQQPVQTGSMILGSVMVGILNTEQGLALWNTSDGKGFTDEDDENDEDHAEELCDDNCEELKWPESALGRQSWQQIR